MLFLENINNTKDGRMQVSKKCAFVLSGGGAKGSFQVGVIRRLFEKGIVPEAVWGTSVGALNGAGIAYAGIDKLEQIWRGLKKNSDIVKFQLGTVIFATKGLYSTAPLHNLVKSFVDGLPETGIYPHVCMNNLYTGQIAYVNPWNCDTFGMTFDEAILASASIPLAMEPVHGVWCDGGVRETVPLKEAIRRGYEDLYVIMCTPWTKNPKASKDIKNWAQAGARALDLLTHEIFVNDVKTCLDYNDREDMKTIKIHLYAPSEDLKIDTLEFDPEKIRRGIETGYNAEEIGHDFIRAL